MCANNNTNLLWVSWICCHIIDRTHGIRVSRRSRYNIQNAQALSKCVRRVGQNSEKIVERPTCREQEFPRPKHYHKSESVRAIVLWHTNRGLRTGIHEMKCKIKLICCRRGSIRQFLLLPGINGQETIIIRISILQPCIWHVEHIKIKIK